MVALAGSCYKPPAELHKAVARTVVEVAGRRAARVEEVVRRERPVRHTAKVLHMVVVLVVDRKVGRTETEQVAVRHTVVEQPETRSGLEEAGAGGSSRLVVLAEEDSGEVVVVEDTGQQEAVGSSLGYSAADHTEDS